MPYASPPSLLLSAADDSSTFIPCVHGRTTKFSTAVHTVSSSVCTKFSKNSTSRSTGVSMGVSKGKFWDLIHPRHSGRDHRAAMVVRYKNRLQYRA